MEVIIIILVGVIVAFVLANSVSSHTDGSEFSPPHPPHPGTPPDRNKSRSAPPRPLRADAAEVFPLVFDAQEQVVRQTKELSKSVLEKVEKGSEADRFLHATLEEADQHLEAIETNRHALQSTIDSMPEDHVLLMPDFDNFMGSMLDQWLSGMYDQWPVASLKVDYDEALTPDEREAEKARLALEGITKAIELLDQVKMAGAVSAENTRECIGAFMVDLISADGKICARELTFMNRVFARDWDTDRYLTRYAAKLDNDKAATELIALLEELGQYNLNMSIFLNRSLQPIVSNAITADGNADEAEMRKLSAFNGLLQQRLGATGDLREALKSA